MATIVVIDDSKFSRSLAVKALEGSPHEVYEAEDGEKGLDAVEEYDPYCVICDLLMPNLDGIGFLQRLRDSGSKMPVIFMTSLGNDVDRLKGFEAGGDDYVIKPLNHRELLARMKRFVDAKDEADVNLDSLSKTVRECVDQMQEISDDQIPAQLKSVVNRLLDELQGVVRSLG